MLETTTNSIGMTFVLIPAGSFRMGGDKALEQAEDHENPCHRVTIKQAFWIGQYAVTQVQWSEVMHTAPGEFKGDQRPVEGVSWHDARAFIHKLNALEEISNYCLPTEAQWEYAARANSQGPYYFSSEDGGLSQCAWHRKNSGGETQPVGQLKPNAWGLYDMLGNVHEWCQDWFDRNYYTQSPGNDPSGPAAGLAKALRGGDWGSAKWYCRCASRSLSSPDRRSNRLGFRLVRVV